MECTKYYTLANSLIYGVQQLNITAIQQKRPIMYIKTVMGADILQLNFMTHGTMSHKPLTATIYATC